MTDKISVELPGVTDPEVLYHYHLGVFHAVWGTVDVTTDFAIGMFLKVPHEEALMITWGLMFGAKAPLLVKLIKRSDHPNKQAMLKAFNAIRGLAKRDIVAHGYQIENGENVGFLEKPRGAGDFTTKHHLFTRREFAQHVNDLIGNSNAFYEALGAPDSEIEAFVDVAMSLDSKAATSPGNPTSSK